MIAKGVPSLNQNPKPWIIKAIRNIGNNAIWIYPNTWNHFSLMHFIAVIAIQLKETNKIIPVMPGIVVKSSWQ